MKRTIIKAKYLFLATGMFIFLAASSCKKYIDISTPPDSVDKSVAFADSSTATGVILGIYSGIASNRDNNGNNMIVWAGNTYGAMSADEGYYLTNTNYDDFKNNQQASGNSLNSYWGGLYTRIGRINYAVEGLTSSNLSVTVKNQLLGEAKFMRAWLYFNLVNNFGDVPLMLTTDALKNGTMSRNATTQVFQQITQDLLDAKGLLTTTYPSAEKARINKNVVSAFLSKVYMYQNKWPEAEAEATAVISSGTYSLVSNLANVFLNNSTETIWQISLAGTSTPATIMGAEYIPASTTPSFVMYDTLANTFETGDQRKSNWAKSIVYLSKTYYYPYKYKLRTATAGNEYPIIIRLAELYLNRAEARVQQNNISGAQADLNIVRNRAGLANTTATTQSQLLSTLEHERWVELFTEADRWFNLKRLNKATAVLSLIKLFWKPFQQLYPIPQQDIAANANLIDNPGY